MSENTKQLQPDDAFHPDTRVEGQVVGFYSVEGRPLAPRYEVILLGRTRSGRVRTVAFVGSTAAELHDVMAAAGWDAPAAGEIARLCESAGRSQRITRDRGFTSEAAPHV